jgi:LmbE family N-acetylglucosaminyl deacetylase
MKKSRILILSPHTDDGEFGCGGTINKLINQGCEVYYISFSFARKSIPDSFPKNSTAKEVVEAASKLGIKKDNLIFFDYEVRLFPEVRQHILENMVQINSEIKPDLVFMPNSKDTHQDHNVIYTEGYRAFKKTSMLGFESLWNNSIFDANFFVCIDEENLKVKMDAIRCYKSQAKRNEMKHGAVEMLAKVRGSQIYRGYAECFENIRYISEV